MTEPTVANPAAASETIGVGHQPTVASEGGSTIHDLGYRRYDGPRVGASGAFLAVYTQGLRAMFGLGRPAKAKIIPVLAVGATFLSALGALMVASVTKGQAPIRYGQVIGGQFLMFVLFLAAQIPEVISRDQQHRLLPLLFTRDLTRQSYILARFAAIFTAVFGVAFAPLLLLYIGEIGLAANPSTAFGVMGGRIWPILALATLCALAMTGLCGALAAWTPRRAYATAAIFGTFLLLAAVSRGVAALTGANPRTAELIDPLSALRTLSLVLFDETTRGMELDPPLALSTYVLLLVGLGVGGLAMLLWRMRRIRV